MEQEAFDAAAYWGQRRYKKWVVRLTKTRREGRRKVTDSQTLYVGAQDSAGAIREAKYHSRFTGKVGGIVRLATPWDLGCVAAG